MEKVEIRFKGDVDEDLSMSDGTSGWGFAIKGIDGQTAYVEIGSKKDMSKDLAKRDDDPILLLVDAININGCDIAIEMLQQIMAEEMDIILNGELVTFSEIQESLVDYVFEE